MTGLDGKQPGGGGVDKFRIQIWDKNNNNAVIYDAQPGAPQTATPTTALGGGDITIHSNGGGAAARGGPNEPSLRLLLLDELFASVPQQPALLASPSPQFPPQVHDAAPLLMNSQQEQLLLPKQQPWVVDRPLRLGTIVGGRRISAAGTHGKEIGPSETEPQTQGFFHGCELRG